MYPNLLFNTQDLFGHGGPVSGLHVTCMPSVQDLFMSVQGPPLKIYLSLSPCAQDLFVGVEDLSPVQWHPFTSRAGPEPHTLLAHVKGYGPWTQVRHSGLLA